MTIDARGCVVCPGLVDIHAHLRYPGFVEKETIASGTSAAVRGGFTTVCAMANGEPPTDSPARVEQLNAMVQSEGRCRVAVVGAITRNLAGSGPADWSALKHEGCTALSDDGNPVMSPELMADALRASERLGVPVIAHEETRDGTDAGAPNPCWTCAGEAAMVERDIELVRRYGGRLHIAHVSCDRSVELIGAAQAAGLAVTAEAAPHHLDLSLCEDAPSLGLPPAHGCRKVNPPLRARRDVEAVRAGLSDGIIDSVATDHAPHALSEKLGGMGPAAFGFTGFELALPLLLRLVRVGQLSLVQAIARLTCGPARTLGLDAGSLAVGRRADICVFDPLSEWTPTRDTLVSKSKNSPFHGQKLQGRVRFTIQAGEVHSFAGDHALRAARA